MLRTMWGALKSCAAAALLLVGCGGGGAGAQFPTQGDLQKLQGAPAPARIANPLLREVDGWDLKDPPAQPPEGTHTPGSPWEKQLAEAANARQGLLATPESMNCLAKQIGQFYLAQGGIPTAELSDFMAARCAVVDTEFGSSLQTLTSIGNASDDALYQQTRGPIQEVIEKELTTGNQTAGIWFGRLEQKAVVVVVRSPRRIVLEHVPFVPRDDGHITVRGEILIPIEKADALINQGRFGVKECTFDPQVRLPRFAIDCSASHDDVSAALEIGAFPPARFTGKVVSHLVVWPAGQVGSHFTRAPIPTTYDAPPGADLPGTLTTLLNSVRKEAGLSQVTLNAPESKTAAEVAPHYFAAMVGAEPESVVDQVVMGLRAGWQIPGLVGYGMFTSSLTRDPAHAGRLLTSALDRPSGRQALLDPEIKTIAIGPVSSREQSILGAVFGSYTLLEPSAKPEEIDQVLKVLTDRRKERGLPAPTLATELQSAMAKASQTLESGQKDADGALQYAMQGAQSASSGVQGWFSSADKLEHVQFPDTLLKAPALRIAIGVAHYKTSDFPWALRGVLLVVRTGQGGMVASTPKPRF
jgi:hypothetical protein